MAHPSSTHLEVSIVGKCAIKIQLDLFFCNVLQVRGGERRINAL